MWPQKIRRFTSLHYLSSSNSKNTNQRHIWLAVMDHWFSKLSANIQCKKNNYSAFWIFQKLCQNINKKKLYFGIFWALKSKLEIIHAATSIVLFLPDSNHCFFICVVPYIPMCLYYFLILYFYFHLLFHSLLAKRHILQFTMFDSISLQPAHNITEIRNTS